MKPGLAGYICSALIDNLNTLEKMQNRDQLLRNEVFSCLQVIMNKADLIEELNQRLLQTEFEYDRTPVDILFYQLLKVHNFISHEKIQVL